MRNRICISEISKRLADNIEAVCLHLLPHGKRRGRMFEVGSIHGEPGKTLKVSLEGDRRGRWCDWNGAEEKGDALDLWAKTRGIPLPEALREAKEYLGVREPVLPEKPYSKPKDDAPAISPEGAAMQYLTGKRKIEPAIVNRFRVQVDATKRAIVFPCYSPTGNLINRSYRADVDGKKKVWQDTGAAPCLFGWHALDEAAFRNREVLICEGQIDAMTWTQWGIPALSIPSGSGRSWLDSEWANLEAFTTIFLSFDQDDAGQRNLTEVLARLGKHRTRVVRIPHKDANDALLAGATSRDAAEWVKAAEYASLSHLVSAKHYTEQTIAEFFPPDTLVGHYMPITMHEDPDLHFRFRPGELSIWTGITSHGKSTLLNFAMLYLAYRTLRPSCIVSLEMNPAKVLKRIILASGANVENAKDVRTLVASISPNLLFCDKIGKITKAEVFELLNYAHARYNIGHVAIDSLMRIAGLEEDYPAQNEFITDLVTYARETGVHVHLVAHPRKSPGHTAPQGHDIKGSGHIRDNADNVLVVWRNKEKEEKLSKGERCIEPDAKLIIEKDREDGAYRDFKLSFNREKFAYSKWKAT